MIAPVHSGCYSGPLCTYEASLQKKGVAAAFATATPPQDTQRTLTVRSYLTFSFAEPALDCALPAMSVAYTVYV
jgi:hypothetical protein